MVPEVSPPLWPWRTLSMALADSQRRLPAHAFCVTSASPPPPAPGAAMRDRTRELRQDSGSSSGEEPDVGGAGGGSARSRVALLGLRPPPEPCAETLQQARGARAALAALQLQVEALERLQEAELGTALPQEGQKLRLQQLRDEIQEQTQALRSQLKALEPGKEEEEEMKNSIGARVRRTQHRALCQQLQALTGRCHLAQAGYRQRSLERIRRQLHIAGSAPLSEEELEQMVESGQCQVFSANVLGASRATLAALQEVELRHKELQRLERGLRELAEIYSLLGASLEGQGEVLDRVERNILDSGTNLGKGREHLGAAQRSQRGARQKKLLVAACVGVSLLVLVTIIAVSLGTG